jgi:hypothetical protein
MNVIYSFTNPQGIGDNLRGFISVLQIQEKLRHLNDNINFHVNFSHSLIGNFLVHKLSPELQEIANTKEIKVFLYWDENCHHDEIMNYILNSTDTVLHINTNNFPDITNISDDIKNTVKNLFQFTPEFLETFNSHLDKLNGDFDVFHCRFGDDMFYNDCIRAENHRVLIENIQQSNATNCLVLSDSFNFKKELYDMYNNNKVVVFLHKPTHTRDTISNEEAINIFIDFFLITKAKNIYCWGIYYYISNFILWNSYIYDIPLKKINL